MGFPWVVSVCVARASEMGGGGSVGGFLGEGIAVVVDGEGNDVGYCFEV